MNYMRDNTDPQATGITEVLTGIRSCPGCESGLEGRVLEWQERIKPPGQQYGMELANRRLRVLTCSKRCGWVVAWGERANLIGQQRPLADLGLPEKCSRGHLHSWAKVRRFGNRVDFICAGLMHYKNGPQNQPCQLKAWVWIGDYHGFLKKKASTPYGETRNQVLGVLSRYPGGAPLSVIVRETGLKQTTILGCIGRMLKAKYAYLWRTDTPEPLPVGLGHRYGLTNRGWQFIEWGVETGVYEKTEPDVDQENTTREE